MRICFVIALLAIAPMALAAIKTETVEYKDGDTTLKGFVAYEENPTSAHPAVLVVHEWWGLNDYVKSRCEQLAKLGYVAFAADIYGEGFTTADPKVAGAKMGEAVKRGWRRSRTRLALEQLHKDQGVDQDNIAIIGYCFGGGCALEAARAGENIKGVVSFHGSMNTDQPAQKGQLKAKVLLCHGDADPMVPMSAVEKAQNEFKDAGVDVKVITYPGAKHAFTNPDADKYGIDNVAYNKEADEKSWQAMKEFLADVLK